MSCIWCPFNSIWNLIKDVGTHKGTYFQEETSSSSAVSGSSSSLQPKEKGKEIGADKTKEALKEIAPKRSRKKEKNTNEKATAEHKKKPENSLSVLPVEASAVGIVLLILLTSFYVACVSML